jgi:hypothetical protein
MQLVAADVVRAELLGRATEVPSEPCDVAQVRHLRLWGEIAKLHVLDHALTKSGHGVLPWKSAR